MKKINLLFAVLMLLMLGNTNKIFAETVDIVWSSYAKPISSILTTNTSDPTYVYLYNVKSKQFITCGGMYGMQGIMTNVGMKFYITQDSYTETTYDRWGRPTNHTYNFYNVHSNVTTPATSNGNSLSVSSGNVYVDRSDNIYWNFVKSDGSDTNPIYNIRYSRDCDDCGNNWNTYYLNQSSVLELQQDDQGSSCDWMIITREDYLAVTAKANYEQIDVTGLLEDSRFDRNSNNASSWMWGNGKTGAVGNNTSGHSIGVEESNGGASDNNGWGKYFAAEIDNESNTLSQTVTDLEEGIYRIACQGFYYNNGNDNANSYLYAKTNTANNYSGNESSILLNTYTSYFSGTVNGLSSNSRNFTYNKNIAAGNIFLGDETNYPNEVYIYVHEGQSLTFGLKKTKTDGSAFVDNFKLYYCGKNEIYLNEEGTEESLDKGIYKFPCRLNYRRAFTKDAWNAIVLPISLSGSQVRAAFGEDAKLSELVGINPDKPSQILFKTVNLGTSGIEAGKCYVIWVTADPDVAVNKEYDYSNNNTKYKIYGPLYQIEGVTKTASTQTAVTDTYTTDAGSLTFNGYYYKTTTPVGDYVYYVTSGDMYYDKEGNFPIYATRWTLKDANRQTSKYTFNFDGISEGNGTTAIENINTDTSTNAATSNTVYNLNGQVVRTNSTSLEGLAKGIYIVNGKKYIVK
jgi:hypothetical protein